MHRFHSPLAIVAFGSEEEESIVRGLSWVRKESFLDDEVVLTQWAANLLWSNPVTIPPRKTNVQALIYAGIGKCRAIALRTPHRLVGEGNSGAFR